MANPRSGKAWFEAMGRSETSRGMRRSPKFYAWPLWAQQAYMKGKLVQLPNWNPKAAPLLTAGSRRDHEACIGIRQGLAEKVKE